MLLLVVLLMLLFDVTLSLESVAAKISEYDDIFVNFTSTAFAMCALRHVVFLVVHFSQAMRYLKYGIALILAFIGAKLLLQGWYDVDEYTSMQVASSCFDCLSFLCICDQVSLRNQSVHLFWRISKHAF